MVMIVVPAFMVRPSGSLHTIAQTHLVWHNSELNSATVRVFHLAIPSNPVIQHTQIHLSPVHPHLNLLL